uniref:uncharacterized protein LOC109972540 isoform X1 n=1 Tax=Monopterus albus TaxID=43700 RepID=UPI0009B3E4AA|nr:uncharacterized protein LOC109972540 isoform X1 [Monopterus albus]
MDVNTDGLPELTVEQLHPLTQSSDSGSHEASSHQLQEEQITVLSDDTVEVITTVDDMKETDATAQEFSVERCTNEERGKLKERFAKHFAKLSFYRIMTQLQGKFFSHCTALSTSDLHSHMVQVNSLFEEQEGEVCQGSLIETISSGEAPVLTDKLCGVLNDFVDGLRSKTITKSGGHIIISVTPPTSVVHHEIQNSVQRFLGTMREWLRTQADTCVSSVMTRIAEDSMSFPSEAVSVTAEGEERTDSGQEATLNDHLSSPSEAVSVNAEQVKRTNMGLRSYASFAAEEKERGQGYLSSLHKWASVTAEEVKTIYIAQEATLKDHLSSPSEAVSITAEGEERTDSGQEATLKDHLSSPSEAVSVNAEQVKRTNVGLRSYASFAAEEKERGQGCLSPLQASISAEQMKRVRERYVEAAVSSVYARLIVNCKVLVNPPHNSMKRVRERTCDLLKSEALDCNLKFLKDLDKKVFKDLCKHFGSADGVQFQLYSDTTVTEDYIALTIKNHLLNPNPPKKHSAIRRFFTNAWKVIRCR